MELHAGMLGVGLLCIGSLPEHGGSGPGSHDGGAKNLSRCKADRSHEGPDTAGNGTDARTCIRDAL